MYASFLCLPWKQVNVCVFRRKYVSRRCKNVCPKSSTSLSDYTSYQSASVGFLFCLLCRWLGVAPNRRRGSVAEQEPVQRRWAHWTFTAEQKPKAWEKKFWKSHFQVSRQWVWTHLYYQEHGAEKGESDVGADSLVRNKLEIMIVLTVHKKVRD